MGSELKQTIASSRSRKVSLGNYEMEEVWHMESIDLPADASTEQRAAARELIAARCELEIDKQVLAIKERLNPSTPTACSNPKCEGKIYKDGLCFPCWKAVKGGAEIVKEREKTIEELEAEASGRPF